VEKNEPGMRSSNPRSSPFDFIAKNLLSLVATPFGTDAAIDEILSQVLCLSRVAILKSLPDGIL
jgi:hypothetical protein